MTDFFADLESELLGAARRRAVGARPRRRRPSLPVMAAASVAAIAALLVLVLPSTDSDRGSVSPPSPDTSTVVAVLNGTSEQGLAARAADDLIATGFPRSGKVHTWRSQVVRRSRVVHAPRAAAAARIAARRLGIATVRPATAGELRLGGAPVVVILGFDQAARPDRARTVEIIAGRIALYNATANDNRITERVADRLQGQIRFDDTLVAAAPGPDERFSRVLYGAKGRPLAARVARVLGILTVRPVAGDPLAAAVPRDAGDPIVVLGTDQHEGGAEWIVGPEARIVVVDGSGRPGLARRVRDRLRRVGYRSVRLDPDPVGAVRRDSAVGYGPGAKGVAERMASFLRIERVDAGSLPAGADVVISVGQRLRTR